MSEKVLPVRQRRTAIPAVGTIEPSFAVRRIDVMKKRSHVALLIEASRWHGRRIIEGVARYATEHGSWSLHLKPRNITGRPLRWLTTWQGDDTSP